MNYPLPVEVAGLVQAFKMLGVEGKYLPFLAIGLGAFLGFFQDGQTVVSAINGAFAGLFTTVAVNFVKKDLVAPLSPPSVE